VISLGRNGVCVSRYRFFRGVDFPILENIDYKRSCVVSDPVSSLSCHELLFRVFSKTSFKIIGLAFATCSCT